MSRAAPVQPASDNGQVHGPPNDLIIMTSLGQKSELDTQDVCLLSGGKKESVRRTSGLTGSWNGALRMLL